MDTMHLIGAEDVRSAGSTIRSAADEMRSAADTISAAVHTFEQSARDLTYALERVADVLNKLEQKTCVSS